MRACLSLRFLIGPYFAAVLAISCVATTEASQQAVDVPERVVSETLIASAGGVLMESVVASPDSRRCCFRGPGWKRLARGGGWKDREEI